MDNVTSFMLGAFAGVLLLFDLEQDRPATQKRKRAVIVAPHPLTIEDWIKGVPSPTVWFSLPYSPSETEVIKCRVSSKHLANDVSSDYVSGIDANDALQKAVAQIEETIGDDWRSALPKPNSADSSTQPLKTRV